MVFAGEANAAYGIGKDGLCQASKVGPAPAHDASKIISAGQSAVINKKRINAPKIKLSADQYQLNLAHCEGLGWGGALPANAGYFATWVVLNCPWL